MSLGFSTQISDIRVQITSVVSNARIIDNLDNAPVISGILQPYIVLRFGSPVEAAQGRGIVGTARNPHVLWCHVHCVALTDGDAQDLLDDVLDALVGFQPTGSGEMRLNGGFQVPINSTDSLPARVDKVARFTFTYNL